MIEIPKDSIESTLSPFQEEVVLENYFASASRAQVLTRLQEGLREKRPLLVLTGEEGSGKTMLCRLLEADEPPSRKNILISWSVDSFEDIIRIVGMELGLNSTIDQNGGNVDQVLEEIIELLLLESIELFVIFDEAENIYLATLERIRKMLDRVLAAGVSMQILFSGRDIFLENIDQLSICDFENSDSLLIGLQPLTEEETADYLKDCESRLVDQESKDIFTAEVIAEIYAMAQGNYRMTNILAEESVRNPGDDTSFMVLLENVKDDEQHQGEQHGFQQYFELLMRGIPYLPWIGGAVCCLLILMLFFNGDDEEDNVALETEQVETLIVMQDSKGKIIDPAKLEEQNVAEGMVESTTEMGGTASKDNEAKLPVVDSTDKLSEDGKGTLSQGDELLSQASSISVEMNNQQQVEETPEVSEQTLIEIAEQTATELTGAGEEEVVPEIITAEPARRPEGKEIKEGVKKEAKVVQLQTQQAKKKKMVLAAQTAQDGVQKILPKQKITKKKATVASKPITAAVEQLYKQRLAAGASWKRKDTTNLYTVQLMVLAAKDAELNFKEMLSQVNYRQEAGNFYLFKKTTSPESLYVFYGEYSSIDIARLVKDSLPQFLRDHKPYPLAIEKAITKVAP